MPDFHGIQIIEVNDGVRSLSIVATAIIGVVVTGPDADAAAFPFNKPVLVTDVEAAIGKAGATGTMSGVLRAIVDQAKPVIALVRVEEGADAAATNANVIGTTDANGQKTGMQALLAAESQLGIKPRIIAAPGLDSQAVTTAMIVVAQKLRAMVYASAIGANVETAITYAANFSARELMLIYGDFKAVNDSGATVTSFAAARAIGLRARIDRDTGFWKTLSNVAVQGGVGVTKDIGWDMTNLDTEAGLLNAAGIATVVRTPDGYRFWGNRTRADEPLFAFESATRTAHVLIDTIGAGMMWAIDKPLRPSLVKDIVETINATFRALKSQGAIIGANAWFDADKNSTDLLAAGKVTIDYDYTPVPPLEQLTLNQRITDSYFADFAAGLQN